MHDDSKYNKTNFMKKFNIINIFSKLKIGKKQTNKFEKLPSLPPSPVPNKNQGKRISLPIIPNLSKSFNFTSPRMSFQNKRNSYKEKRPLSLLNFNKKSKKPFFKCRNIQVESTEDFKVRSLSLENERNDHEVLARKQLRSIRSFDEMIYNGFDPVQPNLPRPLTVSFSITPKLRSEALLN